MNLAVIPARGGSRRIPGKNVRAFCGRPIIAWSIEAALASGCFDDVIVSTDDPAIAAVARSEGASVPFIRPPHLADDHTPTLPVVAHALEEMSASGTTPEMVCCLYATAVFVTPELLRDGLRLLERDGCDYAFTVSTFPFPVQRALRRTDQGVTPMFPEFIESRSQDLEEAIHDAGQFYWGRAQAWAEGRALFGPSSTPLMVPRTSAQDIDTEEDWSIAERLFLATRQDERS